MSSLLFLNNFFDFIWDIVSLIPKFVYFLSMTLASFMDLAQLMLRKIAGLDTYYLDGTTEGQTGDIALAFLRGIFEGNSRFPAIKNAFWALVVLGVILLIITTFIANIRQEYMPSGEDAKEKPSNNKMNIIKRAIKSLFMFFIVPVSVIFGLLISDVLLKAFDSATSSGQVGGALFSNEGVIDREVTIVEDGNTTKKLEKGILVSETLEGSNEVTYLYYDFFGISYPTRNVTFSGQIFKTAAYNSNRLRTNKTYKYNDNGQEFKDNFYTLVKKEKVSSFNLFNKAENSYEAAQMVDEAFAGNVKLQTPATLFVNGSPAKNDVDSVLVFNNNAKVSHFTKYNVGLVWYYYDLWQFNFIIAFAFYFVALKILVNIVAGLAKRIIEMIALFLVSPPIVALMPLDGEKAFKEWRKTFISKSLMAYGAIIGMNIYFLIMPYLNEIKFINPAGLGSNAIGSNAISMINMLISILFMLVGLMTVESFIEILSNIISSESAPKVGGELVGKVGDTFQKSLDATAGATGAVLGGLGAVGSIVPRAGIGLANAIGRGVTGDSDFSVGKAMKDSITRKRGLDKAQSIEGKKDFTQKWAANDSIDAYDDYLKNETNKSMLNSYENRTSAHNGKTFDEWRDTDEGKSEFDKALFHAKPQSFEEFAAANDGAGKKAYERSERQYLLDKANNNLEEKAQAKALSKEAKATLFNKDNRFLKAAANEMLEFGSGLSAFYSHTPGTVKDAFDRGGKISMFNSMAMAFTGKTAKQISEEHKIAKIKGDEQAKAKFHQSNSGSSGSSGSGISKDDFDKLKSDLSSVQTTLEERSREVEQLKTDAKIAQEKEAKKKNSQPK